MAYVLCYTKSGVGTYPDHNYPGHVAMNCDWEHAVHFAISEDGIHFKPLRNNTGVLFARAAFDEGNPRGTTKTLAEPWLFRDSNGSFMLCAIRRNQNAPDTRSCGAMQLYASVDLVQFQDLGLFQVSNSEIHAPRCEWDPEAQVYKVLWKDENGCWRGQTHDFVNLEAMELCPEPDMQHADYGIDGCVPGNVIPVSDTEAETLRAYLDEIRCVGTVPVNLHIPAGKSLDASSLPGAVCLYNDGSTHSKPVKWDADALSKVDTTTPGIYTVRGRLEVKQWPFPMRLNFGEYAPDDINDPNMRFGMSDPCVTAYKGRYYLSSTGNQNIVLRCADRPEDTFAAEPVVVYRIPLKQDEPFTGTWAAELHEIDGKLYMFTALCPGGDWTSVQACVLRCHGDPLDPTAWEAPHMCAKEDGSPLTEDGISLDMTWFRDDSRDYVMWSNRRIQRKDGTQLAEPADIFIATVNPSEPWRLTSAPVRVIRPMYGWDRYETEVDEGPYLLRHGDDLFVTVSGSSTGMTDLYNVGLLRAKTGTDLLNPTSWEWWPYPLLTKESVPGQYGPGHNSFVKDSDTGDDLMVYHAVPHDAQDRSLNRQPGIRRVHWASTGLPYLEMTPERDFPPEGDIVEMTIIVE